MPVLDHDVHASTRKKSSDPYGCCNREISPHYAAMNRVYLPSGGFRIRQERVKHTMSTECRHDNSLNDPGCAACKHRGSGEEYAEAIRNSGS